MKASEKLSHVLNNGNNDKLQRRYQEQYNFFRFPDSLCKPLSITKFNAFRIVSFLRKTRSNLFLLLLH